MYGQFLVEPFDLRVWEIARMTDWQLEAHRRAVVRQAEAVKKMTASPAPVQADGGEPESGTSMPADREAFVAWWKQVNGGDRESALAAYAREFPNEPA